MLIERRKTSSGTRPTRVPSKIREQSMASVQIIIREQEKERV